MAFPTSRLVYARGEGAESCPSEATARHAVEARLGYDPFSLVAEKIIVAEIMRDRDQLRGRVELVDEGGIIQGAREFHTSPAQCDDLVATMALAISIAIDPASDAVALPPAAQASPSGVAPPSQPLASTPPPTSEPEANQPAAAAAAAFKPSSDDRREATVEPLPNESKRDADHGPTRPAPERAGSAAQARAGWTVMSSFGTAPDLALGMAASLGVRLGDFSLNVEGRGDWPASGPVASGGTARTSLVAGTLVPCFHRGIWFVCGLGVLGSVQASSEGLRIKRDHNALYVAAGARAGVEVPLAGPFFFRPELDGLANFSPVELQVDESTVWKAPPFSALIGAGVFASFP